jgi:pantoate--beta-alanine ligase
MEISKTIAEIRALVRSWKAAGLTVGLTPTMGFLHEGHKSLIRRALDECDKAVVTIFVNPTQFGPNEDLSSYPRDLEGDLEICRTLGASAVFCPETKEMYPSQCLTFAEAPELSQELCGRSRPGHFRGVLTVVAKLFNITQPDKAYFGLKDAQQYFVIRRMVKDLNFPIEMVPCPTVRESDGLALSSRNSYLSKEQRKAALILAKALAAGRELIDKGEKDPRAIENRIKEVVQSEPLARLDYATIVDLHRLTEAQSLEGGYLTALAVNIGQTRLIDNFIVEGN